MAFQIVYIFQAVDRFSKVAAKIEKSIKGIEKKVEHATKGLHNFEKRGGKSLKNMALVTTHTGKKFGHLDERIKRNTRSMKFMSSAASNLRSRLIYMAGGLVMTGFGLTKMIKHGKETAAAVNQFSALFGIVGKDLDFLKKKSHEFARVFGMEAKEIFIGFKRVAGLKPELLENVDALAELTKWTLILDAPMGQIEKVARALTVALNVYGKSAKNAAEFSNILAAAQRKGSAEVIDLALSFLKAGPVAKAAQVPFLDLIAMMESIARSGILRQMAGTSIRTLFIRIANMGKEMRGKDMLENLEKVHAHLMSIKDPMERLAEAGRLFGKRQASAGIELAANVGLARQLKKETFGTNFALETANKILTEYGRQSQAIWSVWQERMDKMFTAIEPHLLALKRQWTAFLTLLDLATPGGLKSIASFFITLTAIILKLVNLILFVAAIFKIGWEEPFDFGKREALKKGGLQNVYELMMGTPKNLESIMKPGDIVTGTAGANGKVSVDINLKGNTEAVTSLQTVSEGDVDVNTGQNLAFIG